MLTEYSPSLATDCENAVQAVFDTIIADIKARFNDRIPSIDADAKELPKECQDLIRQAVKNLSRAERFTIRCYGIEFGAGEPSDEEIAAQVADYWLTCL